MRSVAKADALFIGAAAVAVAVLLWLGAGLTFFSDEWALIEARSLTEPGTWLAPHNEHWTTLSTLIYRALVETVGLRSYVPYLVVLVALHIAVSTSVYLLVRRSSGPWPGLATATVVLLFGSGFENLFWAFQITFVGSMATGLAAMLALETWPISRARLVTGVLLLMASLTMSGIGLICLVAVGVELLLDPGRRRVFPVLLVPAAGYGVWYVLYGRLGVEAHQGLFRLGGLVDLPPVIMGGLSAGVGSLAGVGRSYGSVVLILMIAALVGQWVWRRRVQFSPRAAGCLAGVVALYGLIALSRSFVGPDVVDYSRYTYESGILLAVGLSAQVGRPDLKTPGRRRAWLYLGGLVLVVAIAWNFQLLLAGRTLFQQRAERTRALVTVALQRPLPASTDPARSLVLVPSPQVLAGIVDGYGSPLTDTLVPWAVPAVSEAALEAARRTLAEGAEIPLPDVSDQPL